MSQKWELCIVNYPHCIFYTPDGQESKSQEEVIWPEWATLSKQQRKALAKENPQANVISKLLADGWMPIHHESGTAGFVFRRLYREDAV